MGETLMLGQIIKLIRLLGFGRAVRMKRRHEEGLKYVRGYAACSGWWALMNEGLLDELADKGQVHLADYAAQRGLDRAVLDATVEYLDKIGLLHLQAEQLSLAEGGRELLAEPRGLFELLYAYEPCFANLEQLLKGQKRYGRDLERRITYVGLGSGRLCEQLPYPIMRRMVLEHGCKQVLDLGCGDLALLAGLCRQDKQIRCHGVDFSPEMVRYDEQRLAEEDCGGRLTVQLGDVFDLPELPPPVEQVDCVTACDTFHEYLQEPERIVDLLNRLKERFRGALLVVGEFCLQDGEWLRRHPTASLEHHLFHELSGQQIGTAAQWRDIFAQAALTIVEEQVFDMIGHGYFALRAR